MNDGEWTLIGTLTDRALGLLEQEGGDMIDETMVSRCAGVVVEEARENRELKEAVRLEMLLDQVRAEVWDVLHNQMA